MTSPLFYVFLREMCRTVFVCIFCGLLTSTDAAPEPQIFAENSISTSDDESHPGFTPDGKTLYFLKNDPSFNHWTIVVSREQNGKWSTPEVAPFSGQFSDADPFITLDGQRFFFISTHAGERETRKRKTPTFGS